MKCSLLLYTDNKEKNELYLTKKSFLNEFHIKIFIKYI